MKKTIIYLRIACVAAVLLLISLIAFQLLPLTYNESHLIGQVALQSTRAQRMAKDALILGYRPASAHVQAISELQNSLPAWEQQQAQMQRIHNADVQTLLNQALPDYVALDTAANKLLARPDDLTQVQIILQHERNYSLLMNQISTLIQERIQAYNLELILIQSGIAALIMGVVVWLFALSRQPKTAKKEVI